MIRKFSVENFYSFKDRMEVDFSAGETVAGDDRFRKSMGGGYLASVLVCYGANASGKTNILKALAFLTWFFNASWQQGQAGGKIPLQQYAFQKQRANTSFFIETECAEGKLYRYHTTLNEDCVVSEQLLVKSYGTRWRTLVNRKTIDGEVFYTFKNSSLRAKDFPKTVLRTNASFFSAVKQMQINVFDDFINSVTVLSNVVSHGRGNFEFPDRQLCYNTLHTIDSHRNDVVSMLKEFDIGIDDIRINKIDLSGNKEFVKLRSVVEQFTEDSPALSSAADIFIGSSVNYVCKAVHIVDGEEYLLPIELESDGSKELLVLLHLILTVLKFGGTLVYDELEHGIHPNILPRLFDLFNSHETNPRNAQLFCTCHTIETMRNLHKSQMILVEKDTNGCSSIYKLDSVKGVRNDDNHVSKYLTGVYGAVPRI